MIEEQKPDCSNHSKEVAGISDMKVLAEMIGDLHYESLAELNERLKEKYAEDAGNDLKAENHKVASDLALMAYFQKQLSIVSSRLWQTCKPLMEQNKTDQP